MSIELSTQPQRKSVLMDMASRFNMESKHFEATLKATVIKNASNEEFAAFLLVAKEYNLNPLTKEIYAFPAKGGGIQPVVSIDGWLRIINEHPKFDGAEFKDNFEDGNLVSITCLLYRKDRKRPMIVTEYLSECKGVSEPWKKWPIRMLRHKALIQCARYAFGFSNIIDPDEADRMKDITPPRNNSSLQEAFTSAAQDGEVIVANKLDELLINNLTKESYSTNGADSEVHISPSEIKCQQIIDLVNNSKNIKELESIITGNELHALGMAEDLQGMIYATIDEKRKILQ